MTDHIETYSSNSFLPRLNLNIPSKLTQLVKIFFQSIQTYYRDLASRIKHSLTQLVTADNIILKMELATVEGAHYGLRIGAIAGLFFGFSVSGPLGAVPLSLCAGASGLKVGAVVGATKALHEILVEHNTNQRAE